MINQNFNFSDFPGLDDSDLKKIKRDVWEISVNMTFGDHSD